MNEIELDKLDKLKCTLSQLDEIFRSNDNLYLWIINYSITHSLLELAIHEGNYPKGYRLTCGDCHYLSGPTQGSPYELQLIHDDTGEYNYPEITILGNKNELVIKCSRITFSKSPSRNAQTHSNQLSADSSKRIESLRHKLEQTQLQLQKKVQIQN